MKRLQSKADVQSEISNFCFQQCSPSNASHIAVIQSQQHFESSTLSTGWLLDSCLSYLCIQSTNQADDSCCPPVDMLSTKQEDVIVISDYAVH